MAGSSVKWEFKEPRNSGLFDLVYARAKLPPVIQKGLNEITGTVYTNVFFRVPVASGNLRNSLQESIESRTGRVFFVAPGSRYAAFADQGRAPGRQPPTSALMRWIRTTRQGQAYLRAVTPSITRGRKMSMTRILQSAAFILARKIGRKGTEGHDFWDPAIDASQDDIKRIEAKLIETMGDILH